MKTNKQTTSYFLGEFTIKPNQKYPKKTQKHEKQREERTHITVVGRWHNVIVLLSIKYVDRDKVALGVSVLAGFRGRNLDNLSQPTQSVEFRTTIIFRFSD